METTQYIVLSGNEKSVEDVDRCVYKLVLPNPVSISYRHVGAVSDKFVEPLIKSLHSRGVKEITTIFAEKHSIDQINRFCLDNSMSVLER